MNLAGMSERFKTEARVIADVVRGRALVETLVPSKRNRLDVVVIERCKFRHAGPDGIMRRCSRPGTSIWGECAMHGLDLSRISAIEPSFNSRVDAGASWQAGVMGSAAGVPSAYIALSTATLTPAKGDTTLASEIVSGTNAGLARALATYQSYTVPSALNAAASYQEYKLFTTSAAATVVSAAQFTASSGGSLFVEANLATSATLGAANDQLAITWTVNI